MKTFFKYVFKFILFMIACCIWLFIGFLLDTYVGSWAFKGLIVGTVALGLYGIGV